MRHKSPNETDRPWSWSLLQMRDFDSCQNPDSGRLQLRLRLHTSAWLNRVDKVALRWGRLLLGWVNSLCRWTILLSVWPPTPTQPGHPFTGSHSDDHGHCWRRNGEFCVTLGPVNSSARTLDKIFRSNVSYSFISVFVCVY